MRTVVSDTGPLNYLALIDRSHVLEPLFGCILIPATVFKELSHRGAPVPVRTWIAAPPPWLSILPDVEDGDPLPRRLGDGERQAILLARVHTAELVLMDDRAGVAAARGRQLAVIGTLGLIDLAARRGLLDVGQTVARLRHTNFRCPPALLSALLERHAEP